MAKKEALPTFEERTKMALDYAKKQAKKSKRWIDYSNALFGIGGELGKLFPAESDRIAFRKTPEHQQILKLADQLDHAMPLADCSGVITLRCPRSLHAALLQEAEAENVSLNQLCVAKLSTQLRALV